MEVKPLYRLRFTYPEEWSVRLTGPDGSKSQHFLFLPDFQGVIETDDHAVIFTDVRGYGRAYPAGRRQIVVTATHLSEHDAYRWLNDVVCLGVGEVRAAPNGSTDPTVRVLEIAELIWQPIAE